MLDNHKIFSILIIEYQIFIANQIINYSANIMKKGDGYEQEN